MVWLLGIFLFLVLFFSFPAFRVLTAVAAGLLVLAGLALWAQSERDSKARAQRAEAERKAEEARWEDAKGGELEFRALAAPDVGRPNYQQQSPVTMSGSIKNTSNRFVSAVTLFAYAYDCPAATTPHDQCERLGFDGRTAEILIPAGEVRAWSTTFYFANLPNPVGEYRFAYKVMRLKY